MASAEAGSLLIAPERTPSASRPHFAWWKLNPSTGEAISVLDTGLNGLQDLGEDATIEVRVVSPMARTLGGGAAELRGLPLGRMAYADTQLGPLVGRMPGQGTPLSICQDVFMTALDVLVELGEDIDLDNMITPP
jgi:hypothetical protein